MLIFIFFCAVSLLMLVKGFLKPSIVFEVPWMAALLSVVWIIPYGITVERTGFGDTHQSYIYWIHAVVCFALLYFGFGRGKSKAITQKRRLAQRHPHSFPKKQFQFNRQKAVLVSFLLVVTGGAFLSLSARVGAQTAIGQQWVGVATFYYLLSQFLYYGLALAALLAFRKPTLPVLTVIALALLLTVPSTFQFIKRHIIFEILIIFGAALFFVRRFTLPRSLVAVASLSGMLMLHQVGAVRDYVKAGKGNPIEAVISGHALSNFAYFNLERAPEIEEGIYDVEMSATYGDYNLGADYWNRLIHQYVPAFLVGREVKNNLMFETDISRSYYAIDDIDYGGATRTGIADTFVNFWFTGSIFFLTMGYIMGRFYGAALLGDIRYQFLYVILLNDTIFAITDSSARFLSGLPFLFGAYICISFFIRRRSGRSNSPRRAWA